MMKKILWGALFLSAFFSFFFALQRHKLEKGSRTVEVALDYDDFRQLCQQEGLPFRSTLLQFKEAGVTSIALPEITLQRLYSQGMLYWVRGEDLPLYPDLKLKAPVLYPSVLLFVKNEKLRAELGKAFSVLLGREVYRSITGGFLIQGKWEDVSQIGLGFLPEQEESLRGTGILIDPRLENPADVSHVKVDYLFGSLPKDEVSTIIFSGLRNEVLGYDQEIPETADLFKQTGLSFGYIEAYDPGHVQKGSVELAAKIPSQVVKVQALILPQLLRVDPEFGVDTFSLGVRERNVRILYFRPFLTNFGGMSALQTNLQFLATLWQSLDRGGIRPGKAEPFPRFEAGPVRLLIGATGIAAAFLLLLILFFALPDWAVVCGFGGVVGVTLVLASLHRGGTWVDLVGFAGAVTFPLLSVVLFSSARPLSFLEASVALVKATGLTVCGGFLISCLYTNNLTILGVEEFRGVKGVLVLPVVFGAWLAWLYKTQPERVNGLREGVRKLLLPLKSPATLRHLAILLILAAAGGIMVIRSGNQGSGLVPGWERTLRIFLETTLKARPRFKEFAIGHPCFILAEMLGLEAGPGFFFMLFGSLGQADVMDSFAHLHTPLYYTLLRTFHGVWLGLLIGWILAVVMRAYQKEGRKT